MIPLFAVAVSGTRARADDAEEKIREARIEFWQFASSIHDAKTKAEFANNNFYRPPGDCTKAKELAMTGVAATDTFEDGAGNKVLWKHAGKICDEYTRLHALSVAVMSIKPELDNFRAFRSMGEKPDKSVAGDAFRVSVKSAEKCVAALDKAIAAGVVTDVEFLTSASYGEVKHTLPTLRQECIDYVKWGSDAATADDNRKADELKALTAKYGKFGITGDRLKYLIANGHRPIWGKGCGELDMKGLASSPVFYELGQDDLAWIVYKTQFKKNKQIKYTSKRFRKDGSYTCK